MVIACLSFSEELNDHEVQYIRFVFEKKICDSMRSNINLRISTFNALKKIQSIDYSPYYTNKYSFLSNNFVHKNKNNFKRFYSNYMKKTINIIEYLKVDKNIYKLHYSKESLSHLFSENKISKIEYKFFKKMINHHFIKVKDKDSGEVFYAPTTSTKGTDNKLSKLNNKCVQELSNETDSLFDIKQPVIHVL